MRSISEIYDEIIQEKEQLSSLSGLLPTGTNYSNFFSDLTTGSKVAIWRLWAYVIAVAIYIHEGLFEVFRQEVNQIAEQAIWGSLQWYQANALKFQFGYTLTWDGSKYVYSQDDSAARIVKYCAVEERIDGVLVIKAAKDGISGPQPLNSTELTSFQAYCQQTKFAGTLISVVSFPADSLKVQYDIYYDAVLPVAQVRQQVESAVVSYIRNLPFNGRFTVSKLTDALQKKQGIIDPVFVGAEARYGLLPFQPIAVSYNSNAGYLEIDSSFPLSSTINYIPYE